MTNKNQTPDEIIKVCEECYYRQCDNCRTYKKLEEVLNNDRKK